MRATLYAIDNPEFNCTSCLSKFSGRQDEEKMLSASRRVKSCASVGSQVVATIENDDRSESIKFRTCPGNFFSYGSVSILGLHKHFKEGFLPFAGPLAAQPNKILEAFSLIDVYNNERLEKERKRQEQKNQRLLKSGGPRGR